MRRRVLLDFTATKSINNGLGQFSIHLGNAIIAEKPVDWAIDVLVPRGREALFPNADGYRLKNNMNRDTAPRLFKALLSRQWIYDLWHVTNQNSGFIPLDSETPMLLTIHDLNFLRERSEADWQRKLAKIQSKVDRAHAINTISEFVKQELLSHLHLKNLPVHVVHNGGLVQNSVLQEQACNVGDVPFLFSIGEFLDKKNFLVLLDMMLLLPELNLVIAGKIDTSYGAAFIGRRAELGLDGRVFLLGCVTDQQRHWLYKNMHAFVFPSLTEGFGLPVIEAMSYKKPVFCSNLTSLPEIAGDHAFYWTHFEPKYMQTVFRQGMSQVNRLYLQQAFDHASQFNWSRAAKAYIGLYSQLFRD